jgi:glycosyltransferase involved in cell wall biosynthesis
MQEENRNFELNDKAPVTVVIPCFRCVGTIGRAIESIALQTLKPQEIIAVDDASGDETLSVLRGIEQKYSGWLKIVSLNDNQGAGGARNAGWNVATQPLIAFLDADDTWHSRKIEIQYTYMSDHPEVVLSGHGHKVLCAENINLNWELDNWMTKCIPKRELLLSNKFITPSVMVRRDIKQRFNSGQRYMEDHMLWLDIVCSGGVVTKLSAELAAIHKGAFGAAGLSAQLWLMEKGDLGNYRRLYLTGCINIAQWLVFSLFSWIKYVRRIAICWGNWLWGKSI